MPAPKLPKEVVLTMLRYGMSNAEILEALKEEPYNISDATPSAISMIRHRAGIPPRMVRHSDLLPWRVSLRHQRKHIAGMLRLASRARAGEVLAPRYQKELDSFLKMLSDNDWVIHYEENDPTGQGWYYFKREDFDTDIIRDPAKVA